MTRLLVAIAPLFLAATAAQAQTAPRSADPHAGHAMPTPPRPSTQPPQARPHAQHPAPARTPAAADPHAGHTMPPAPTSSPDPHAGHDRGAATASPQADPHAGHAMHGQQPAPADPHAGHDMTGMSMGPPNVPTSANNAGRPPETPPPAAAFSGPAHAADLVFGAEAMAASRALIVAENGGFRSTGVVIDRLEASFGDGNEGYLWDLQGWTGGDINRFWWKSEGGGDFGGGLEDAEFQALYGRAITPFWDIQAGIRQDVRPDGPDTTHAVLGFQGLAPHWWEVDAAAFLSTDGDLTARIEAEYDQRITQRWILQPRIEVEASAGEIPELDLGSGLTSVEAGLRLRYEIRKEFAPYLGVEWSRMLGETADRLVAAGGEPEDTRVVVGLRAWF